MGAPTVRPQGGKGEFPCSKRGSGRVATLEFLAHQTSRTERLVLDSLPVLLGRTRTASFVIAGANVSKEHAEIYEGDGTLRIRDLGSTNGTYVNGERITDVLLQNGAIIQLGNAEMRLYA